MVELVQEAQKRFRVLKGGQSIRQEALHLRRSGWKKKKYNKFE